MSKRHSNNRRKTYGRRQHEVHERRQRDQVAVELEPGFDDLGPAGIAEHLAFMDPRTPRLHYALGD